MTGTFINIVTVLVGSTLGILLGNRLPDQMRETVVRGLGLVVLVIGVDNALDTHNILIPLGSIALGGILGEWWDIDGRLNGIGQWLERRFNRAAPGDEGSSARFVRGFVTASLVFCVGPLTILGSIEDGLGKGYQLLAVKSMLDGFASLAFASSLGIGVAFSVITIFVYQGALSLLAAQAEAVLTMPMQTEMFATGGIILLGLAVGSLLELKPIRSANYLPALLLAPLAVWLLTQFNIPVAPQF